MIKRTGIGAFRAIAGLLATRREFLLWAGAVFLGLYRIVTAGSDPTPLGWLQDMGTWNHGAKHWALYGEWTYDDFAPQFVTPVHSWMAGWAFRLMGLGFTTVAVFSCLQIFLLLLALLVLYRDVPFALRAGLVVYFGLDRTVTELIGSGTNECTMLFWLCLSFLVISRWAWTRPVWILGGAFYALAVLTKIHCLIFVPAILMYGLSRGRKPFTTSFLGMFLAGFLCVAVPVFWGFLWPHREAWLSTLAFFHHYGENYNRPFWAQAGAFLFNPRTKIFTWENPFVPAILLAVPVWGLHLLRRGDKGPDEDRIQFYGWLAVWGFAGLAALPAYPRRAAMLALPLGYLTVRVLTDRDGWREVARHVTSPRAFWSLFVWGLVAASPAVSYLRESFAREMIASGAAVEVAEGWAGYLSLAAALVLVPSVAVFLGSIAGVPRDGTRWLAAGGAFLTSAFLVLPVEGIVRRLAGAPGPLGPVLSAGVVVAAVVAGGLIAALVWRVSRRRELPGAAMLGTFAVLFVVLGLGVLAKRIAGTAIQRYDFERVTREIARDLPPDAVVLGDAPADALLVAARCKVVTPWAWIAPEREKAAARVPYVWNEDAIGRFRPTHVLVTDEWGGKTVDTEFSRRLALLSKTEVARYDLRGEGIDLYRLD